jgi:hypothetical protein
MDDLIMSHRMRPREATEERQLPAQSTDKFARLKRILREMFKLDRGDLDFGVDPLSWTHPK